MSDDYEFGPEDEELLKRHQAAMKKQYEECGLTKTEIIQELFGTKIRLSILGAMMRPDEVKAVTDQLVKEAAKGRVNPESIEAHDVADAHSVVRTEERHKNDQAKTPERERRQSGRYDVLRDSHQPMTGDEIQSRDANPDLQQRFIKAETDKKARAPDSATPEHASPAVARATADPRTELKEREDRRDRLMQSLKSPPKENGKKQLDKDGSERQTGQGRIFGRGRS